MNPKLPSRSLTALLAAQLLLSACSATARPPLLPAPQWPVPQPLAWSPPVAPPARPQFQAPSASHCARPIQTREVPGQGMQNALVDRRHGSAPAGARREEAETAVAGPPATPALTPSPARAPRPAAASEALAKAGGSSGAADRIRDSRAAPPLSPQAVMPQPAPRPAEAVTAGMVDDNAAFGEYLAFRGRTQVAHRPRDVHERYLLEVRDSAGHAVADAEVAVQAANGAATWARTDTGGRVWLHPRAFDGDDTRLYDVSVRKQGQLAHGILRRGQKSALEVVLPQQPGAAQRARLDLVFLIDATGSMADEIHKLKTSLRSIANEVARLPSQPDLCFGLVAYRDRGDAFVLRSHDFTNDLGAFQGVLDALQAGGGGDYPEAMNEAFHETVHALSWRGEGTTRLVVLLADAPPHLDYGGPYYDDDMLAALGKGIKVFSVGASGLDRQGEYIQRQIAQYTGGRFVFLTYADARRPSSGPGRETVHDVSHYSVDTLDRLIVRLVGDELGRL
ncbi:MAG: VWA domain-containing protein [Ramlibacter sp.]|nr:VWA domain-containing protein [Ramlibacter sp.]